MNNPRIRDVMPDKTYPWWPVEPGVLYNQMISPVVPYALAGAIWYQGESNRDHPDSYGILLKTMVESWRKSFKKDFPFYLVQIAPFTYNAGDNGAAFWFASIRNGWPVRFRGPGWSLFQIVWQM